MISWVQKHAFLHRIFTVEHIIWYSVVHHYYSVEDGKNLFAYKNVKCYLFACPWFHLVFLRDPRRCWVSPKRGAKLLWLIFWKHFFEFFLLLFCWEKFNFVGSQWVKMRSIFYFKLKWFIKLEVHFIFSCDWKTWTLTHWCSSWNLDPIWHLFQFLH